MGYIIDNIIISCIHITICIIIIIYITLVVLLYFVEPVPPVKPDLTVENVDLNISTNSKEHHTNEYSISEEGRGLIVRRGQIFDITIELNRDYDVKKDDLKFVFLAGIFTFNILLSQCL